MWILLPLVGIGALSVWLMTKGDGPGARSLGAPRPAPVLAPPRFKVDDWVWYENPYTSVPGCVDKIEQTPEGWYYTLNQATSHADLTLTGQMRQASESSLMVATSGGKLPE